jgi:peroxiredoxin Q/BCP
VTRLKEGDLAPDFELNDAEGRTWRLSDLKGERVILYFYPADDTPGCTLEACDFRDAHDELAAAGYRVLGVSPNDGASHRAFADRYALNFPLLIDDDHAVAEAYGAWGERTLYGNTVVGIIRSTFVIGEDGHIRRALYNVKAKGHVDRLRAELGL